MILEGVNHAYRIEHLIATATNYQLYLAQEVESGTWCVVQVSHDLASNGGLSRAAFILGQLAQSSRTYDEAYGADHDGKRLHYDRLFPSVIESFTSESQGKRRVNVLSFTDVANVPGLLPLSNLRTKDRVLLDLKTGAWVMGRLLKLLGFAHEQGIAIRSLRSNNILIDKDQHFAIVLDWTTALVFQETVDRAIAATDIAHAAQAVMASYGATAHGLPYSYSDSEARYVDLLRDFADGGETDAVRADARFYGLVREIWNVEFYPFTTLPIK